MKRQSTAEDIVFFFEAGTVGAASWRLDARAQQYADEVLKAIGKLEAAYSGMQQLNGFKALWEPDDPKWQRTKSLESQLRIVAEFQSESAAESRKKLKEEFMAALRKTPEIDGASELPNRILQALNYGKKGTINDLYSDDFPRAMQIAELVLSVREHHTRIDSKRPGLHFWDYRLEAELHQQYRAIAEEVAASRRRSLDRTQSMLDQHLSAKAELEAQKAEMRNGGVSQASEEFRRHKLRILYHVAAIKNYQKSVKETRRALGLTKPDAEK